MSDSTKQALVSLIASGRAPGDARSEFCSLLDTAVKEGLPASDPLMIIGKSLFISLVHQL